MLDYIINRTLLRALIDEQVSHVADEAYGDNGMSLYDSIILTEKDDENVTTFIDEAVRAFVARMYDVSHMKKDGSDNDVIEMYLPDFDTSVQDAALGEITHYIVFSVCAAFFQSRRPQAVELYSLRAKAAMDRAVSLLKSRKHPTATW